MRGVGRQNATSFTPIDSGPASIYATIGGISGRQHSNLRPLVPQTSAYFQAEGRVQLECFRRVLVGKSTSPRKLESAGIECTQLALSRPTEVARSLPYFGGRPRLERAIHTLLRVLAPFP